MDALSWVPIMKSNLQVAFFITAGGVGQGGIRENDYFLDK
jgi:hypothetical protein